MAISLNAGSGGGPRPTINLTPLIDVVLVLLIIFMIITPLLQRAIAVQVPLSQEPEEQTAPEEQLLVEVEVDGIELNGDAIELSALAGTLSSRLAARSDKTVFVRVHDSVIYQNAVAVMDIAHQAGAQTIGTVLGDAVTD